MTPVITIFTYFAVVTALLTTITSGSVFLLEVTRDDRDGLRLFLYSVTCIVSSICFAGYVYIALGYEIQDGTFFRPMMPILFAIASSAVVLSHSTRSQYALIKTQREIIETQKEKLRRIEKRIP